MTAALGGGELSAAHPGRTLPRERPGTHFTGGWVGHRAGLDGRTISFPPGFDLGTSSPWSVTIPTELPGPRIKLGNQLILCGTLSTIQLRHRNWFAEIKYRAQEGISISWRG